MNVLADLYGQNYDDAYARAQRGVEQRARVQAGRALAGGDPSGAAREFYGAGMVEQGDALEQRQQQRQDREIELQHDQRRLQLEDMQIKAGVLTKVANALLHAPMGQRKATLDRIKPALAKVMDTSALDTLTEDMLTDDQLRAFGAEVDNHVKLMNTSGGVVAVDQDALSRNINDPNAHRVIYQDPYYAQRQEAQIEATQAQTQQRRASAGASNARAYRSMHPVARGGGGGGGLGGLPPGYRPK